MLLNRLIRRNAHWLLLLTALILLLLLMSCDQYRNYKENERKENFYKNYEVFQKLEEMQRKDINFYFISLERWSAIAPGFKLGIDNPFLWPNTENMYRNLVKITLSKERWNEYKKLLKQANVDVIAYDFTSPKRKVTLCNTNECQDDYIFMEEPLSSKEVFNSYSDCKAAILKTPSLSKCYLLLRKNWYHRIR